jgi:hypothetical protein
VPSTVTSQPLTWAFKEHVVMSQGATLIWTMAFIGSKRQIHVEMTRQACMNVHTHTPSKLTWELHVECTSTLCLTQYYLSCIKAAVGNHFLHTTLWHLTTGEHTTNSWSPCSKLLQNTCQFTWPVTKPHSLNIVHLLKMCTTANLYGFKQSNFVRKMNQQSTLHCIYLVSIQHVST